MDMEGKEMLQVILKRFDRVDERLDKMDERFEKLDNRLDVIEHKVECIEKKMDGLRHDVAAGQRNMRWEIFKLQDSMDAAKIEILEVNALLHDKKAVMNS